MRYLIASLIFCFSCAAHADDAKTDKFVRAAIALENPSIRYESTYRKISYPNGDVPADVGVCSDVVIRAYRAIGIDLQKLVHDDMKSKFNLYPKLWGLKSPDTNIDHRRVPNLQVFFKRHGTSLPITREAKNYKPGDIVTWNLKTIGSLPHIGIVTDQKSSATNRPMMMHNIGAGQVLEDMLFDYTITGHYRYGID